MYLFDLNNVFKPAFSLISFHCIFIALSDVNWGFNKSPLVENHSMIIELKNVSINIHLGLDHQNMHYFLPQSN